MPKEFRYDPVGRCIYCGATSDHLYPDNLSDEHIIPYGLGGLLVLPESSCAECSKITCRSEDSVLRKMYGFFRDQQQFKTRHKKDRKTDLLTDVETRTGEKLTVSMPITSLPGIIPIIHYNPPGLLRIPPVENVSDPVLVHLTKILPSDGRWRNSYRRVHSPWYFLTHNNELALAQMLAKIAHSYAVAVYGIDGFEHWLTPIIRGKNKNYGFLIGGVPRSLKSTLDEKSSSFQLKSSTYHYRGIEIVVVYIWYFAELDNSPNCVVVGRTTNKFTGLRQSQDS